MAGRSEHTLHTEAVVLRHYDMGEADRLIILYTRQNGKVKAIVKGARRLKSRKAGHLQPFGRVALLLARGRDLWIVTQAETVDAYLPLRDDLVRTGYAAYVVELLDRFTYEEGANFELFRLLTDTLKRIADEEDAFWAVRYYEIRLLDLLGFRPQLFYCVNCQNEIRAEDQFFSALEGGVLCPNCGPGRPDARPVSMLALKFMRHFQRSSYSEARRAQPLAQTGAEMENLLQYYLTYLLERGVNAASFLRDVRRNKPVS